MAGGKRVQREGYFIEPTLFTNCKDDMKIVREEIFGPVISVLKFKDVDEVIKRANDTPYGLVGSVFSANQQICHKVAKGLQCGQVYVNNYFQMSSVVPFGGYKQSGIGRELSQQGLDRFMETKTIVYDCN